MVFQMLVQRQTGPSATSIEAGEHSSVQVSAGRSSDIPDGRLYFVNGYIEELQAFRLKQI